jgi:hypothetical protein
MELKRKLSRYLNDYKYKKYFKVLPILCILIVLYMNSSQTTSSINSASSADQLTSLLSDFQNSFVFSNTNSLISQILILIALWTGYKYWLLNYRVISRNRRLTGQVLFTASIVVLSDHINYNSNLGKVMDFIIFLALLYTVLASSWLSAKIIDSFDLQNDLYCWGLRIIGVCLFFFGFIVMGSGSFALVYSHNISSNIIWIMGLCIILIGAFSEYRSFRRHGVFVYIR